MKRIITKEDLLELLDLEHGQEFTYYENLAELLETEAEIEEDAIMLLFKEMDMNTFSELLETYFFDIMEYLPDNDIDLYNIFESVKRNLIALSHAASREEEEESHLLNLSEELERFHRYYSHNETCVVTNRETKTTQNKTLRDAISDNRLANMDNKKLDFDTEEAKNYEMEEYVMSFYDLSEEDDDIR